MASGTWNAPPHAHGTPGSRPRQAPRLCPLGICRAPSSGRHLRRTGMEHVQNLKTQMSCDLTSKIKLTLSRLKGHVGFCYYDFTGRGDNCEVLPAPSKSGQPDSMSPGPVNGLPGCTCVRIANGRKESMAFCFVRNSPGVAGSGGSGLVPRPDLFPRATQREPGSAASTPQGGFSCSLVYVFCLFLFF